jgi:hypothetical protein
MSLGDFKPSFERRRSGISQREQQSPRLEAASFTNTRTTFMPPVRSTPLRYYASCAAGLEATLAKELADARIGALQVRVGSRGVEYDGDAAVGYRSASLK